MLPFSLCTADFLSAVVTEFQSACSALSSEMAEASSSDENVVRYINNKLMSVERAFIHDEGLPGRPYFK